MGKFMVTSNLGGGAYYGYIVKDLSRIDGFIATIDEALVSLNEILTTQLAELATNQTEFSNFSAAYLSIVNSYGGKYDELTSEQLKEINDAYAKVVRSQAKINSTNLSIAVTQADIASKQKQKTSLENSKVTEYRTVWCAEFHEGLANGLHTTAELDQDNDTIILLTPNSIAFNGYPPSYDEKLMQPTQNSLPFSTLYNIMALPAAQRHKPTFKKGVITNINTSADTCTVLFTQLPSKRGTLLTNQKLPVNEQLTFHNVPIQYSICNSEAFTDGETVLVQFNDEDWTNPKVIGYCQNPVECPDSGGGYVPIRFTTVLGTIYYDRDIDTHIDDYLEFQFVSGGTYYYYLDTGVKTITETERPNEKTASYAGVTDPNANTLHTVVDRAYSQIYTYTTPTINPVGSTREQRNDIITRTIWLTVGGVTRHSHDFVDSIKRDWTGEKTVSTGFWTVSQSPTATDNENITHSITEIEYWRDSFDVWTLDFTIAKQTDTWTYYVSADNLHIHATINRQIETYVIRATASGETILNYSAAAPTTLNAYNQESVFQEFASSPTDQGATWNRITDTSLGPLSTSASGPILLIDESYLGPPPTY